MNSSDDPSQLIPQEKPRTAPPLFSATKNLVFGFMSLFHKNPHEEQHEEVNSDEANVQHIKFDPKQLSEEECEALGGLLNIAVKQDCFYFKKGKNTIIDGEKKIIVELTNGLVYRHSESHPREFRYDIVGDLLGTGAFSRIYKSVGTLIPQREGRVVFKAPHDVHGKPVYCTRIIKMQTHTNPEFPPEKVINEVNLGRLTPYLGGKKPTFLRKNPEVTCMVENYIEGNDLIAVLEKDRGEKALTLSERIELILAIMYALEEQIHSRHIIHRDIKPENILVFNQDGHKIVRIIDLGLSKLTTFTAEKELMGTIGYTAPEMFDRKGVNEKSDIYSLGIVLSLVLGAGTPPIIRAVNDKKIDIRKAKKSAATYRFPHLFKGVDGLDEQKVELTNLLYQFIHKDPRKRPTLGAAIDKMENILYLSYVKDKPAEVSDAIACALKIRSAQVLQEKNAAYNLLNMLNKEIPNGWSPELIQVFCQALSIPALRGLHTKAELLQKVSTLISSYEEAFTLLQQKTSELSTENPLHENCEYLLKNCLSSRLHLDEMSVLTHKIQARLAKFMTPNVTSKFVAI